jgi:hypothetical protein
MIGDKSDTAGFVFPIDSDDCVESESDTRQLKTIPVEVEESKRGYDPYNTGVHRAMSFNAKRRPKP